MAAGSLLRRSCPLCGGVDTRPFVNNGFFDYDRCPGCALVFQNPTVDPQAVNDGFTGSDELLEDYFKISAKYKTGVPTKPDPRSHGKLRDIYGVRPEGRLLDVGCSVGDFLHLAKYFYDVEGVEVNPATTAIAAQHFRVHCGFLSDLRLPLVYDIVTLNQILYGVPDPVGLLRDIHAVLKTDGILCLNTPNSDSYATRLFGGKCCHFYGYTTQNVFNPEALSHLCAKAGFRILTMRTEWLDIYTADLREFYDRPDRFIHKRNTHLPDYERGFVVEDEAQRQLGQNLGQRGNYLVALLVKS
ncbi:MAG: class I SAM-dependent methyltransferase [Rhodospirillaceae bacterium]